MIWWDKDRSVSYFVAAPLAAMFTGLFGCVCLVTVDQPAMKMPPFDAPCITWREAWGSEWYHQVQIKLINAKKQRFLQPFASAIEKNVSYIKKANSFRETSTIRTYFSWLGRQIYLENEIVQRWLKVFDTDVNINFPILASSHIVHSNTLPTMVLYTITSTHTSTI